MRRTYIIAAATTVAVGLTVFRLGIGLAPAPRDILGDALWAMMMFWAISAITPGTPRPLRVLAAAGVCYGVEFSQLLHASWLDAFRATGIGHLMLGSGFDPRDLLAYTVGVLAAFAIDRWLRGRAAIRAATAPEMP